MKVNTIQKEHHNFLFDLFFAKFSSCTKNKEKDLVDNISDQSSIERETKSQSQENIGAQQNFQNSDFLAAIAHELKTPISAILSFADILSEELTDLNSSKTSKPTSQDCINCITEIKQTALEMNELVHDILDVSQASCGSFEVDLSREIDLRDVVKRAVRINYDYSLRCNVNLKVEIADDVKMVKLDAKRMKQILTNLISNAVKYSPPKSEVRIVVKNSSIPVSSLSSDYFVQNKFSSNSPRFLEISVIDQGFGMTPFQVANVFQKYQTFNNPNSSKVDSCGLGLVITKQLVELQNGQIEISSKVNLGTEVVVRFLL